jgi:hypothetical protein
MVILSTACRLFSTAGRYIDEFERIDDVWAIRHQFSILGTGRVEIVEKAVIGFASTQLIMPNNPE